MTFLDFPPEASKKASKSANFTNINTKTGSITQSSVPESTADRILNRVPPKIEPIKSSEVLSRVAAFLPQLAASNRDILQRRPEDVNIEILNGTEGQVIEMKLGLGVFEENRSESSDDSTDSSEEETSCTSQLGKKKIMVLPSELKAASIAENDKIDPFERVINSLLLFDSSSAEEMDGSENEREESQGNVLEFE